MMTEEDWQFSWDDVFNLLGGVVLAFLVFIRQMDDIPAWLYMTVGLLVIAIGTAELRHYLRRKKREKSRSAQSFSASFYPYGASVI